VTDKQNSEVNALPQQPELWSEEEEGWLTRLRAAGPAPTIRGGDLAGGPLDRDVVHGYVLLKELGRGGQGVVYSALQVGTRREVAIKLLREGPLASPSARRRFEREIELAASLDHPSIVRVLEAGETGDGRPFVAMELIVGHSLSHRATASGASPRERLRYVCGLCDAIEHAHCHGVIHLDLKPSNVLVTESGQVKVLDFGLARCPDEEDLLASLSAGLAPGTPAYMAPEQATRPRKSWDRRVDVHAIGLMLFELLTGELPIALEGGALAQLETIAHGHPQRLLGARDEHALGLFRPLARDLDAIIARALERNPQERYATAAALGADLRAALGARPVTAREHERGYRLRRLLFDHAPTVLLVLLVVLGLAGSLAFFFDLSRKEAAQRHLAEAHAFEATRARTLAEERLRSIRALSNTFLRDIDGLIRFLPGSAPARRSIVIEALRQLESLSEAALDDPELAIEVADGYLTIGDVYYDTNASNLGRPEQALESFAAACSLLETLPDTPSVLATRARAWLRRAAVEQDLGRDEQALQSLDIAEANARSVQPRSLIARDLAGIQSRRAKWERAHGNLEAAERLERSVHASYAQLMQDAPKDLGLRRDYAAGFMTFAIASRARGDFHGALGWCGRFLAETKKLLQLDPEATYLLADLALGEEWTGRLHADDNDPGAALLPLQRAIDALQALLAKDPSALSHRINLASIQNRLGEAHLSLGDLAAAQADFDRFGAFATELTKAHPELPRTHRLRAVAFYKQHELALAHAELTEDREGRVGWLRTAESNLKKSLETFKAMATGGTLQTGDFGVPGELAKELADLAAKIGERAGKE